MTGRTDRARESIEALRKAYGLLFGGGDAQDALDLVMADLEKFCRADVSAFHPDQRVHALLEGRREVFLRIKQFSTMTTDEIINIRNLEHKLS